MTEAKVLDGLSWKEAAFVRYFAEQNFTNATQAVILAGYAPRSAKTTAARMLSRANLQPALEAAHRAKEAQIHITPERTTLELARVAYGDATSLYDEVDGVKRLKPFSALTADQKAMVGGIEQKTTTTYSKDGSERYVTVELKVRVAPKVEALRTLALIQGLTPQGNRTTIVNDNRTVSVTLQALMAGLTTEDLRATLGALREQPRLEPKRL